MSSLWCRLGISNLHWATHGSGSESLLVKGNAMPLVESVIQGHDVNVEEECEQCDFHSTRNLLKKQELRCKLKASENPEELDVIRIHPDELTKLPNAHW